MQKTSRNVFLRHPGWCVFHIFSMLQGFPQVLRTWKGSSKFDGGLESIHRGSMGDLKWCRKLCCRRPCNIGKIWKAHPPRCTKNTFLEVFALSFFHLISNGLNGGNTNSLYYNNCDFVINFCVVCLVESSPFDFIKCKRIDTRKRNTKFTKVQCSYYINTTLLSQMSH